MAQASFLVSFALFTLSVSSLFVTSSPAPDIGTLGFVPITQAPPTPTTTTTTTIKPALPSETAFTVGFLNKVNKERTSHSVAPLVVNRTLVAVAQKCAAAYLEAGGFDAGCKFDVSGVALTGTDTLLGEYGVQLPQISPKNDTRSGLNLATTWSGESTSVADFDNLVYSAGTVHFFQTVWSASKSVGCAYAKADDADAPLFSSCIFYPPGNVEIVTVAGTPEMTNPTNLRQNVFDQK